MTPSRRQKHLEVILMFDDEKLIRGPSCSKY